MPRPVVMKENRSFTSSSSTKLCAQGPHVTHLDLDDFACSGFRHALEHISSLQLQFAMEVACVVLYIHAARRRLSQKSLEKVTEAGFGRSLPDVVEHRDIVESSHYYRFILS